MAQAQAQAPVARVKKVKVSKRTFRVTGNPDDGYNIECMVGKTLAVTIPAPSMDEVERFLWKQFQSAHAPVTVHLP